MLYNPDWTKADPFKLSTLISWLETQPPEKEYDYTDNNNCLLAQYFRAMSLEDPKVYPGSVCYGKCESRTEIRFPYAFESIAHSHPCYRTFGDALKRARKFVKTDEA